LAFWASYRQIIAISSLHSNSCTRSVARLRSSLSSLADWQCQYAVGSQPRRSSGGHDAGGSGQRAAGALMNINESRTN